MTNERLQGEDLFHSKKLPLGKALFQCQNAFEKKHQSTTKTELCNGKSYIKKLCNRL